MSIWILGAATIALVLKYLEISPVAQFPWWQILIPFALLFIWFEFGEKLFGLDRKGDDVEDDLSKAKRERIAKMYEQPKKK